MKRLRRVALIYDAKLPYDVKIMRGVARYLQRTASWNVFIEERTLGEQRLPNLRAWQLDGVIANLDAAHVAASVCRAGVPAVGFGGGYGWRSLAPHVPYVTTDNAGVARLGATHLLERGFRHFAYCGYPPDAVNGWSVERERVFVGLLAGKGFSCAVYRGRPRLEGEWDRFYQSLERWLRALPKPAGLMAANDRRARQVLEACRLAGLHVPRDVAVIGVDNDEMLCNLSIPTLSSVEQGCEEMGCRAAALLDALMEGVSPAPGEIVVAPEDVVSRQSTDILAVADPRIAHAWELIHEHAADGWKVDDVARALAISRSTLENHFRAAFHRSVAEEFRRVRLQTVRRLLKESDLPLKQIAAAAGFRSVQHMTTAFRLAFGATPAQFRRRLAERSRQGPQPFPVPPRWGELPAAVAS